MSELRTIQQDPSCDFDPKSVSADQALGHILDAVEPVTEVETIALRDCLGRVVARDVKSRVQVPNHTNSAMDGYALGGEDLPDGQDGEFEVIGTSMAGKAFDGKLKAGQCVRIMTGAVMPAGSDTVVTQERVQRQGERIIVGGDEKAGSNVRYAGEDMQAGDTAISRGVRIGAAHLGLAASLGFTELPVFRRPRVTFFSNGDELRSLGEPLETGALYDSNRYTLYGMLREQGVDILDFGIVRDDPEAMRDAFTQAAATADMVVTSAGASVGEADYVQQTLQELGQVGFWKVAIKPGRPLAFGKINNSLFFGLPGNPVSVMVTFQIFVREALRKLSGERGELALKMRVPLLTPLRKRPGRVEYQRGILSLDPQGETVVSSTGEQGSGILHSMSVANCYIILDQDAEGAEAGDRVIVQPFANTI